jgi:sirohydrochlorin ferrochelatase
MEPWHELLARAESERALAADGRWEELAEAGAARTAYALTLGSAPPEARAVLERIADIQNELMQIVTAARADTARRLGGLHRGRGAMRGYAPSAGSYGGWVDVGS